MSTLIEEFDANKPSHKENKENTEASFEALVSFYAAENSDKEKILRDYWKSLQTARQDYAGQSTMTQSEMQSHRDEAKEWVETLIDHQIYPIVTVPRRYIDSIKTAKKITAHETDIPGLAVVAGTLGILPYRGAEDDRVIFEVHAPKTEVEPRLTGNPPLFRGVIYFRGREIPMSQLHEIKERPIALQSAA